MDIDDGPKRKKDKMFKKKLKDEGSDGIPNLAALKVCGPEVQHGWGAELSARLLLPWSTVVTPFFELTRAVFIRGPDVQK